MGSSFIITKNILEKKGRELMLEFYEIIHDDYFLNETKPKSQEKSFDEIISQRKYYDENVIKEYKRVVLKDKHLFKCKFNKIVTFYTNNLSDILLNPVTDELKDCYKDNKKLDEKDMLMYIEDKIKNKTIELEFVFEFLTEMDKTLNLDKDLEFECSEDLFCLKSAFLKAYDLFHISGYNLKD